MAKDDKPQDKAQDKKPDAPIANAAPVVQAPQGLPAIGDTVRVCVMDGGVLTNEYGYPYPMEDFDVQVTSYVRRCIDRGDLVRL
jgi:hypothetical protein